MSRAAAAPARRASGLFRRSGSLRRNASKTPTDSDDEQIECRICHDDKNEAVVSPCHCKGTLGLVHLTCLQRWLTEARRSRCELCGARYVMHRRLHRNVCRSLAVWTLTPHACTRPRLHLTGRRMLSSDALTVLVALPVLFVLFWACVMLADYYTPTPRPRHDHADVRGGLRRADEMGMGTSAIGARFIVFMLMLIEIVSVVCFCYWVMLVIRKQACIWYFWWQHDVVVTVVAEPVDRETYRRSVVLERRRRPSEDSSLLGVQGTSHLPLPSPALGARPRTSILAHPSMTSLPELTAEEAAQEVASARSRSVAPSTAESRRRHKLFAALTQRRAKKRVTSDATTSADAANGEASSAPAASPEVPTVAGAAADISTSTPQVLMVTTSSSLRQPTQVSPSQAVTNDAEASPTQPASSEKANTVNPPASQPTSTPTTTSTAPDCLLSPMEKSGMMWPGGQGLAADPALPPDNVSIARSSLGGHGSGATGQGNSPQAGPSPKSKRTSRLKKSQNTSSADFSTLSSRVLERSSRTSPPHLTSSSDTIGRPRTSDGAPGTHSHPSVSRSTASHQTSPLSSESEINLAALRQPSPALRAPKRPTVAIPTSKSKKKSILLHKSTATSPSRHSSSRTMMASISVTRKQASRFSPHTSRHPAAIKTSRIQTPGRNLRASTPPAARPPGPSTDQTQQGGT